MLKKIMFYLVFVTFTLFANAQNDDLNYKKAVVQMFAWWAIVSGGGNKASATPSSTPETYLEKPSMEMDDQLATQSPIEETSSKRTRMEMDGQLATRSPIEKTSSKRTRITMDSLRPSPEQEDACAREEALARTRLHLKKQNNYAQWKKFSTFMGSAEHKAFLSNPEVVAFLSKKEHERSLASGSEHLALIHREIKLSNEFYDDPNNETYLHLKLDNGYEYDPTLERLYLDSRKAYNDRLRHEGREAIFGDEAYKSSPEFKDASEYAFCMKQDFYNKYRITSPYSSPDSFADHRRKMSQLPEPPKTPEILAQEKEEALSVALNTKRQWSTVVLREEAILGDAVKSFGKRIFLVLFEVHNQNKITKRLSPCSS
jgi:hypothetical protein